MLAPEFRPRALFDLESIVTYISIALHARQATESWQSELTNAMGLLCRQPDLGRPFLDESLQLKHRRMLLVGNYRIFYSYNETTLTVWRVLHTSQNMDDYALVDL